MRQGFKIACFRSPPTGMADDKHAANRRLVLVFRKNMWRRLEAGRRLIRTAPGPQLARNPRGAFDILPGLKAEDSYCA